MKNFSEPTISDIKTSSVIFFDRDFKDECLRFCRTREISVLPDINDHTKCYILNDQDFDQKNITADELIDDSIPIFSDIIIKKFHNSDILFTKNLSGHISGVIHFCDYNKSIVNSYLYQQFRLLEQSIRDLLVIHKKCNDDLLKFISAQTNRRLSSRQKNNTQIPFSEFNLSDLILFAANEKIISIPYKIKDIRNDVMHMKDLVKRKDFTNNDLAYDKSSFFNFFDQIKNSDMAFMRINNKISLKSMSS